MSDYATFTTILHTIGGLIGSRCQYCDLYEEVLDLEMEVKFHFNLEIPRYFKVQYKNI